MDSKKIAVVFPGIGYHKDKPLLYYSTKLAAEMGYDVIHIEYHDMPQKIKGDAAMMKKAAELAFSQSEQKLSDIDFSEFEDVLFIGKSIGTVALAEYAAHHDIPARQIWYTPVEATFSFDSKNVLAFIGELDPWSDYGRICDMADAQGVKLYTYPACNHSLECDKTEANISYLGDVMKLTAEFMGDGESLH